MANLGGILRRLKRSAKRLNTFDGRWITIGSREVDGKRKGGSPVYVEDGRITKGAPSLSGKKLGSMKEPGEAMGPRNAQKNQADYDRAKRSKEARKMGLDPKELRQVADDMLEQDKAHKKDLSRMMANIRATHPHLRSLAARNASGKIDVTHARNLDQIAKSLLDNSDYAHLFPNGTDEAEAAEHLFDLLANGIGEPMSEADAYAQALDYLHERKQNSDRWEDDAVPFAHWFAWTAFQTRRGTTGAVDESGKKRYGKAAERLLKGKKAKAKDDSEEIHPDFRLPGEPGYKPLDEPDAPAPAKEDPFGRPWEDDGTSPFKNKSKLAQAQAEADSWLKKIGKLPKKAAGVAVEKTKQLYAKMEAKYGSRWAKAIVATAIVTFPTPVMTPSVLAMTGLAHLVAKFKAKPAAQFADDSLPWESIERLAKRFIKELEREMAR